MDLAKFGRRYRIDEPKRFRLADCDPADTGGLDIDKQDARRPARRGHRAPGRIAGALYAQDRWAVLVVFQGDGRGRQGRRDQARHVRRQSAGLRGAFLQGAERGGARSRFPLARRAGGCRSAAASASSTARTTRRCWWCGCIRRCSTRQKLPPRLCRQGHLEGALQGHPRFRAPSRPQRHRWCSSSSCTFPRRSSAGASWTRLEEPAKRWKFSMGDVAERKLWDKYMRAYEDMIRHTTTPEAPWYVVPADHKWFARLVVARGPGRNRGRPRPALPGGRRQGARRDGCGPQGAARPGGRPRRRRALRQARRMSQGARWTTCAWSNAAAAVLAGEVADLRAKLWVPTP